MKYLYLTLIFFVSLCSFSQTGEISNAKSIEGIVLDSKTEEPIAYASVKLLNKKDSTYLQGTTTSDKGRFKLNTSKKGEFILEVSFMGYKSFFRNININDKASNYSLNSILLEESAIELDAAVVEAQLPDVQVKGDTIQYNAGAYKTEEHELLEDLIKKLPGIEIDANGNIKANGKPIQKILVDGKEFFGNDIAYALNNLPANMIKNLQLFKEQSEEAKVTGVKDQDPPQVLNLVVKDEFKKSIFGRANAGYGNNDRYRGDFNLNRMHGDNQYAVVGRMGNTPRGSLHMGSGENTDKGSGVNFNINPSDKIKINGSVDYSYSKNRNENKNESYSSLLERYNQSSSTYKGRNNYTNSRISLDWKIDSLTTIFIRTGFGTDNNRNEALSSDSSYLTGKNPTFGSSNSVNEDKGINNNNSLMIIRRLNSKGRSIRLNLHNSTRNSNSDGRNYSKTIYPDDTPNRVIDNISKAKNKAIGYGITIAYVEPLGKDNRLQFEYSYRSNNSTRDNDARRKDEKEEYSIIDSTYTRNSESSYKVHNLNLRFQSTKEKYNYAIGFNIDPTRSNTKINLGDSIIENITQNTINLAPSLQFGYKPNESTNWIFDYSGNTSQPDSRQLSGDTITHNSLSKSVGNPELKISYNNRFGVYFTKSDFESGRYINISFSLNYSLNDIVDYSIIDDRGNRFSTYRNVDGNMGAYLYATYNTPLKNKKFQLSISPTVYYNKRIGFTNGEKSIIQNISLAPSGNIRFNSEKLESNLRIGVSQDIAFNNLPKPERSSNTRYSFSNDLKLKLPFGFTLSNNIHCTLLSGYGEGAKNKELLWNASIEKLLLKKQGTLQLQLIDILNDRNNQTRSINGNDYSYSWSNNIGSYFILSFSYRFRSKSNDNNTYDDSYMY